MTGDALRAKLAHARRMRKSPAHAEQRLWSLLRDRRLDGLKFRRQVPIGRYIADFVCFRHRLIIEADGPFHDPIEDAKRDAWLADQGFRVLRFRNAETDRERVVAAILAATTRGEV